MSLIETSVSDGVARVQVNHPPLNILTRAVLGELRHEVQRLKQVPDLRVLFLGAAGKHFSAGADVGEHLPPEFQELIPEFLETIRALHEFPLPLVALVQGKCLGGGFELVQPADLVVATSNAAFGQPEILLGVIAPAACVMLPRITGSGVAARILLAGDTLDVSQAGDAGLVDRVVDDPDALESAADELAQSLTRFSGSALRMVKRAMRMQEGRPVGEALDAVGKLYVNELMATADAEEGLRSFLEKRKPEWNHQ